MPPRKRSAHEPLEEVVAAGEAAAAAAAAAETSSSETSSSGESESEGEEQPEEDTVQVDFEALAPIGDDFWGMKKLLEQLLPHTVVDLGDLADAIIADPELASIVKVVQPEDETASAAETAAAAETVAAEATETAAEATETAAAAVVGGSEKPAPSLEDVRDDTYDLYAMTALVDLRRQKDKGSVSAALAWLKKQAEPSGTDIEGWLRRQSAAGLVLANRFVNIPPPLGVRLYSTL
eukprot:UC1_evm1s1685